MKAVNSRKISINIVIWEILNNNYYNKARVLALYKSYWAAMNKIFVYNDVNATRAVHDWSLPMFYQSTDIWRAVLNMFVGLFRIKASEILEKCSTGAVYKN